MPRKPIDYSRCVIYKICCKDPIIKDIYVGHTTDLRKRKYMHHHYCINENSEHYNLYVYQFIRDNGNFDNWEIIVIEEYQCENINQATQRERYWLETLQATLNKQVPSRTRQEWDNNNREYYKQYRERNKDELNSKRNKKFECECGGKYTKQHQSIHFKSKKHLKYLENQINNLI